MSLKLEFKRAIDILSRIVENRVVGTNDVTSEKLSMLSVVLNNHNVDWSMVIFNILRQFIEKCLIRFLCVSSSELELDDSDSDSSEPELSDASDSEITQAPGISDHTGGLLHHLLPGHVELELHVYLTGGDECMHPRLLGMLHRLPSPINIPLIAPGKAAYDRNVFALPVPNLVLAINCKRYGNNG
nr:uncharacterized protein LOC109167327 [Ipomoea batatas]